MSPILQRLAALAESWGGSVRAVSFEEWSRIAGLEVIGVGYWRFNPVEGLSIAPSSSRDLGVFWDRKEVVFQGDVDWAEVVHEMGHVFATNKKPDWANEWSFFGWEYAVAKYVRGSMRQWHKSMGDYVVDKKATRLKDLSPNQRQNLCKERLQVARNLKLVIGNVPQSIRR